MMNTDAPEITLLISERGVQNVKIPASCLVDFETLSKGNNYFEDHRELSSETPVS